MNFHERTSSAYHRTRGPGARRSGGGRLAVLRTPYVLAPALIILFVLFVSIVSGFTADEAEGAGQRFDRHVGGRPSSPPRHHHHHQPDARSRQPPVAENESGARSDNRNENKLLKNIVAHSFLFVCQDEIAALCPQSANKLQCLLAAAPDRAEHHRHDAAFSPECVNWLFSRQICMDAVREIALRNDNVNCTQDTNPRQCLRRVAPALLPPACVYSSYYISVQSAGIVQQRAERSGGR